MIAVSTSIIASVFTWLYLAAFLALTWRATQVAGRGVDYFSKPVGAQRSTAFLFKLGFVGSAVWGLVGILCPKVMIHWHLGSGWIAWLGLGCTLTGGILALGAQLQMAGSWRIGAVEGTLGTLVTRGFFAFSRNPVFVGQLALFAGLALVKPDIVQVILSACVWIAAVWQVRIEEPILAKSLGQGYRDYAARTPRWLGFSKE